MEKVVAINLLQRAREHSAHAQELQRPSQHEDAFVQPPYLPLPPPIPQFPKGFNWEETQGNNHQMQGDINHLREDVS
ncbi:hypothetical protein AHAS_Ahas02G0167900 [Arachis hypogaea]